MCFNSGNSEFTGIFAVRTKKNQPNFGEITFHFDAKGTDGSTTVNYGLHMFGVVTHPDDLPPASSGTDNTITGGSFLMVHSNGPGNKVACAGEGFLTYSLLIVRDPPS